MDGYQSLTSTGYVTRQMDSLSGYMGSPLWKVVHVDTGVPGSRRGSSKAHSVDGNVTASGSWMAVSSPGFFSQRCVLAGNSTFGFSTSYLGTSVLWTTVYSFSEVAESSNGVLKAE